MGDVVNLLGLLVGFVGALLLAIFRLPPLDVTADGRRVAAEEPTPEERNRNLRRYWRNAAATRAGLMPVPGVRAVGARLPLLERGLLRGHRRRRGALRQRPAALSGARTLTGR